MKVAVIGGGSTYTPELVDGIARLTQTSLVTELVLVDPDESRRAVVGPVSARIMRAYGHPAAVSWTADLDDGLDGAGAVLLQLRVGGQAARQRDETWPLDCGCVGQETTGAGGLAKALRTVPVVLEIAERARRGVLTQRPGSSTSPTRSASSPGRCWTPGTARSGCATSRSASSGSSPRCSACRRAGSLLDHVGLNHLTWERAALVDGTDRLPELIAGHGDQIAEHTGLHLPLSGKLVQYRLITCATSTRMTPWSQEERRRRRGPRRWRRSSGSCSAVRRPGAGPQAGPARPSAAARSTRRRPWRCSRRWSATPGTPRSSTCGTRARSPSCPTRR